jgi:hypothetical protein
MFAMAVVFPVQGDSEGIVSILACDNIRYCEKNVAHMNTCLILIGYRDRVDRIA